jgi:PD-(D/E)XK nuclease superfamily
MSGVRFHHPKSKFLVTGAVDDIWVNPKGQLIVVDYKSTAKAAEITSLDEPWHDGYKRQMEVYQWLLRQNGFNVSDVCYWVYANGDRTKERFDATLTFRMTVVPYKGNDQWIEKTLLKIKSCLDSERVPKPSKYCELCDYVQDHMKLVKSIWQGGRLAHKSLHN